MTLRHHLAMAGGVALVALGVLLLFTPGPGLLVLAAGAALLSRESPGAARFFARMKRRLRRWPVPRR